MRRRLRLDDEGAFAVLYAALVVVFIALAAIVIDLASVRQDRRLDRSAADAAALGGAAFVDPGAATGIQPYEACLRAWDYLETSLKITRPGGTCSAFATVNAETYCATASPAEIADERTVGERRIRVAWPIPQSGGSGYLDPDLAPGDVSQAFSAKTDGTPAGCDRLGVAIFHDVAFGLAGAFGMTGTTTQVHSVALAQPGGGPKRDVAALNVLHPDECDALRTTGNGRVTVGPTLADDGTVTGPGIIAVESAATNTGSSCNGGNKAIDPTTGAGSLICASLTSIATGTCDGKGVIESHALDPDGDSTKAYNTAAVPTNLAPQPVPEYGTHGYVPVTERYGCATLSDCFEPTPNFIEELVDAYDGNGSAPTTVYGASQPPYTNPYPGAFTTYPSLCPGGSGITGVVIIPPGNAYANCTLNINNGGVVIHQGGTLVVNGAVEVNSGGCLVMNTMVTTCPTGVVGTGVTVTTPIAPTSDAQLFIRGNGCPNSGCFNNSGSLVIPQTFVYSAGEKKLRQQSDSLTLWTAPGAGARDGQGRTTLQNACLAAGSVDETCMDSRFARMTFWSEHALTSFSEGHVFAGQGQLNVVGVFFTPRSHFNFAGGGSYAAAAAQFWANKLDVNGGANIGLSPYESFSLPQYSTRFSLIR